MCRLAIYLGPELALSQLLTEPEHSLLRQSWEPRELKYAVLNADGYGYGWYSQAQNPHRYVFPEPIWSDPNLQDLSGTLHSSLWFAFIRSATEGFGNNSVNTQPFRHGQHLFMHNGYIQDFNLHMRQILHRTLPDALLAEIVGNTDSEYLFTLIRWLRSQQPEADMVEILRHTLEWVRLHIEDRKALLNLAITDGQQVIISRVGINDDGPSLYFNSDNDAYPAGAQLVASEPLQQDESWHVVPEDHLLILDPDAPPELIAL